MSQEGGVTITFQRHRTWPITGSIALLFMGFRRGIFGQQDAAGLWIAGNWFCHTHLHDVRLVSAPWREESESGKYQQAGG